MSKMLLELKTASRKDFEWVYTEEPHASRRKEILLKHPEIKKLFGHDKNFKWIAISLVLFQFFSLFVVKDLPWLQLLLAAYCIGGILNHSIMLAIHEVAHGMAFGPNKPLKNKLFSIFLNFPIPFPFSITFKYYHLEHHKYQGNECLDTDIPTYFEAYLFNTTFGKFIWVLWQPIFYALRPLFIYPKSPNTMEMLNTVVQIFIDFLIYKYFGGKVLLYLIVSCLLAMGFHPIAGHFISEHYMFKKGFETYSYYGPLNIITFNVGYHNEHHDFPFIPGSRLPLVRQIAPEYYSNLPCHHSWSSVIYHFITDPNIGPYARIKRKHLDNTIITECNKLI